MSSGDAWLRFLIVPFIHIFFAAGVAMTPSGYICSDVKNGNRYTFDAAAQGY